MTVELMHASQSILKTLTRDAHVDKLNACKANRADSVTGRLVQTALGQTQKMSPCTQGLSPTPSALIVQAADHRVGSREHAQTILNTGGSVLT